MAVWVVLVALAGWVVAVVFGMVGLLFAFVSWLCLLIPLSFSTLSSRLGATAKVSYSHSLCCFELACSVARKHLASFC